MFGIWSQPSSIWTSQSSWHSLLGKCKLADTQSRQLFVLWFRRAGQKRDGVGKTITGCRCLNWSHTRINSVPLSSIRPCVRAGPELEREGPPSLQEGPPVFPMESGTHPKSVDIVKDGRKEHICYPQEALLHLPSRMQNPYCLKLNYSRVSLSRQQTACSKEAAFSPNRWSMACQKDIAISDYSWSLNFKMFNFSRHPFSRRERTKNYS